MGDEAREQVMHNIERLREGISQGDRIDEYMVSEIVNATKSICVASEKRDAATLSEIIAALDAQQRYTSLVVACDNHILGEKQDSMSFEEASSTIHGLIDRWSKGKPGYLGLSQPQIEQLIEGFLEMKETHKRLQQQVNVLMDEISDGVAEGMAVSALEPIWLALQENVSQLDQEMISCRKKIMSVCSSEQQAKILVVLASETSEIDAVTLCSTWYLGEDMSAEHSVPTLWNTNRFGTQTAMGMHAWWMKKCAQKLQLSPSITSS